METPEETAAQKKFPYGCGYCVEKREGFVAGAKWQKEQTKSYSKQDMVDFQIYCNNRDNLLKAANNQIEGEGYYGTVFENFIKTLKC